MKSPMKIFLTVLSLVTVCKSAKILYLMPFPGASHYIALKDLAIELAARGHEVYAVTAFKEETHPPTYHQLMVECISVWERLFPVKLNAFEMTSGWFSGHLNFLYRIGFLINELVFNSTDVQNFLKEDHQIDLVVSEHFYNEALYMFAHKYQAPLVLVTAFGNSFKANYFALNPLQLSISYHEFGVTSDPITFWSRLKNIYYCSYDLLMLKFWYLPRQQQYAEYYFENLTKPVPRLEDLAANAALVLMNTHFSIENPIAYLPNFIEVGGLHLKETKPTLPEELKKTLDEAKNGVVLLSFGSNVQSSDLDKERLNAFLKVFGELKQTVLMKWEDDNPPNVPENVLLRKWFPQREVLAHPNTKLFIGHGGLLGLQEAITAGVPILGIPVFGDQYLNIMQATKNGHGEILYYDQITEERLRILINKMIDDKIYAEKAKEMSVRFKDRPMSGIDTGIWWIEYVIRHNGAQYMKTPALKMSYTASNNCDVYLILVAVLITILVFIFKILKIIKAILIKQKVIVKQKES